MSKEKQSDDQTAKLGQEPESFLREAGILVEEPRVQISLDGGETFIAPTSLRVLVRCADDDHDLLINVTGEGVIQDLLDEEGGSVATDSATFDEIAARIAPGEGAQKGPEEWADELIEAGLGDADLDDLVHDLASSEGSRINNSGLVGQIEYLLRTLGEAQVNATLGKMIDDASGAESAQAKRGRWEDLGPSPS